MARKRKRHPSDAAPPAGKEVRQFVVVSYDIPDDRRRGKVCRLLKDFGERVQYSVFECRLRPRELARLQERLRPLLVPKEDDVRFYRLCEACRRKAEAWSAKQRRDWERAIVV